jgi:hypothetical protein
LQKAEQGADVNRVEAGNKGNSGDTKEVEALNGWEGYLGSLPSDVEWHPLVWALKAEGSKPGNRDRQGEIRAKKRKTSTRDEKGLINKEEEESIWYKSLMDRVPDSARRKLEDVKARWRIDETVLRRILVSSFVVLYELVDANLA